MQGETERRWRDAFERLEVEMRGEGQEIVWGLVDGFLLYWNQVRTDPVSKYIVDIFVGCH